MWELFKFLLGFVNEQKIIKLKISPPEQALILGIAFHQTGYCLDWLNLLGGFFNDIGIPLKYTLSRPGHHYKKSTWHRHGDLLYCAYYENT
jgi:hypothetical protein